MRWRGPELWTTIAYWLPVVWAAHHRHRGGALRHPRRLRSRARHSLPIHARGRAPRRDDELGGAVLGRQRDVAGARRRWLARRFSARLCGDHAGALPADHHHAARPHLPRRRLRVSLGGETQPRVLGQRFRLRVHRRHLHAGRGARWLPAGHQRPEQSVCRRPVRLVRARFRCSLALRSSSATRCSARRGS